MAKFQGSIGFGHDVEIRPGYHDMKITERHYKGDLIRNARKLIAEDNLNSGISVNNQVSIVADPYLLENFWAMQYVTWMGVRWVASSVDASQRPRLIIQLGGVYHGLEPETGAPDTP